MATPFSFTGWNTSSVAPAPTGGLPAGVVNVGGGPNGGGFNTVKPPLPRPSTETNPTLPPVAPVATTSVQTGGGAATPGAFSFTGWSSSHLVPKVASAPVVQGNANNLPGNAIPIGQGGPATGTDVGGSGVPKAITDAQSTLETFSNPTLLSFFSNLLNQNKGGGGGPQVINQLSPTQEALNKQKLDLIGEPTNLSNQLRDAMTRQTAIGPAPFGMYAGSEAQRIADQVIALQTRLGPANAAATAAGGLASPYSAISAPNSAGIRRNASGWAASPWI